MLYYLYEYLTNHGIHIPGLGMLKYISFRAGMAVLFSLIIALVYGKRVINYLRTKQMGELVRDLGLDGQKQKEGTPTIGRLSSFWQPSFLYCCLQELPMSILFCCWCQ